MTTISSNNYYDNFSAAIVGWNKREEELICKQYVDFESKYEYRKIENELKSQTIKPKDLELGFASLTKNKLDFYEDLLSMYDERVILNISVFSKMEYVIEQIFRGYHSSKLVNIEMMKYSIIKALLTYHPQNVIRAIYERPSVLIQELRLFFKDRIEKNKVNLELKYHENIAFEEILFLLDDIKPILSLDWLYNAPFNGFNKLLKEMKVRDYSLIIDKEGELHRTVEAAKQEGISNLSEQDSKECVGIRMADMIIGLISRMMQSLNKDLHGDYTNGEMKKKLLRSGWFVLNDRQLNLYKRLYKIICVDNNYWYKTYSGIYSDDLVAFISLLQFMNHFKNVNEIRNSGLDMQPEYYNSTAINALQSRYDLMLKTKDDSED